MMNRFLPDTLWRDKTDLMSLIGLFILLNILLWSERTITKFITIYFHSISTLCDFRLSDNCIKFSESIGCLPHRNSGAGAAEASREGGRTVVKERKEPRKRKKKGKGRVRKKVWKCLLEVVQRRRLKPRHNHWNTCTMAVAELRQGSQRVFSVLLLQSWQ